MHTGKAKVAGVANDKCTRRSHRGNGDGTPTQEKHETREAPAVATRGRQPEAREGQAGPLGVAERLVVPMKPGNAGGGKGPQFKVNVRSGPEPVDWR
jgi:hypothetical protein